MYSGLLIILIPLVAGYLLPVRRPGILKAANYALTRMVYIILLFMGVSLAFVDNLTANLMVIVRITLICALCILVCNFLALRLFDRIVPSPAAHASGPLPSRLHMLLDSLKMCGVVIAGFLIGLTHWPVLQNATRAGEYALLLLLLLVGIQLRASGMNLRQILFNRQGVTVAAIVLVSSLPAGILAALLLGLPVKTGLALSSGFGWYSLSGILMTNAFGPVIGNSAFLVDLLRELISMMLIPLLIRRYRSTALGLCGATSMDFTLPVLQRAGGSGIVPAAIVHGFIMSLLAPIMIAFFSA
ncbi:lysine exporter LysO family protein [Tatumella terrea]|uniref:lysine exporter LysO family protein n=1 Tax=Tatumella terrea TaxID=419007 RepID=UPI0031D498BA